MMSNSWSRLRSALFAGLLSGWRSFIWMARIVIPISLVVALLQWSGWLDRVDVVLAPLMNFLRLPPEAALAIITGMLVNIYGVMASITVIPFSFAQMTLIAIFSLIAHNLILEGIVQHRSGISVFKMTLVRIAAAIVTVFVVSRFFEGTSVSVQVPAGLAPHSPLLASLKVWVSGTGILLLRVFVIIMLIMILLEVSKARGWIKAVQKVFAPIMRIFGLADRATMMFVAGIVFGLLYGGAIIVEEARNGHLTREDAEHLHISLGINHGVIEDPALFAALGLNPLWLLIPRFLTAILAVHLLRGAKRFYSRNAVTH